MLYRLGYLILRPVFFLYRLKIEGKENVPLKGKIIVAANHVSYLDPPVLAVAIFPRKLHFMAKKELFKIPVFSSLISALGAFPVGRGSIDRQALKRAIEVLNKDEALALFPQGTRVREGSMEKIYDGASYLAQKTEALVIPIGIIGTEKVLPEGKKIPRFPSITVKIGEAVNPSSYSSKQQISELTAKIVKEMRRLEGENYR